MTARLLDGRAIAAAIRESVLPDVHAFTARAGRPPGLGIVLVGEDPSSEIYVRNKVRAGTESGLWVDLQRLPADASLDALLALVSRLNASDAHDGILVQSPLPSAMGKSAAQQVFDAIDPAKDVDGFHPVNVGRLVQGRAHLMPCTPSGVIEMLTRSHIPIAGTHAVVIGRSEIVGKPMAMLLLQRDATVTICHSKTPDLPAVAAYGGHPGCRNRPAGVCHARRSSSRARRSSMSGSAPVTDASIASRLFARRVGTTRRLHTPRFRDRGRRASLRSRTSPARSRPCPAESDPLTIAMLLKNTVAAAQARLPV